jgi:hypothetical protein
MRSGYQLWTVFGSTEFESLAGDEASPRILMDLSVKCLNNITQTDQVRSLLHLFQLVVYKYSMTQSFIWQKIVLLYYQLI